METLKILFLASYWRVSLIQVFQDAKLQSNGRRLWIPENDAIEICHDKWKLFEFLKDEGFDTPQTFLPGKLETSFSFPFIAKPRRGEGSKNQFVMEDYGDHEKISPPYISKQELDSKRPGIQNHSVMTRYPESIFHH